MPDKKKISLIKILADRQKEAGALICGYCGCRHSDTIRTAHKGNIVVRHKVCWNCGRSLIDYHEAQGAESESEPEPTPTPEEIEAIARIKCEKCRKLLAKAAIRKKNIVPKGDYIQIKCPKCGFLNNIFLEKLDKSEK